MNAHSNRDADLRPPDRSHRAFVVFFILLYGALTLFLVFHHEPWRDEADVWLVARDLSPRQLFHWMPYAGTPGLWYLLVMIPAKLGLPFFSLSLLHWLLATTAAGILLAFAPFPRWVRVLLIFSYPLGYEYAIIARNYVLIVLALMVVAALYRRRWQHPIAMAIPLAALFSTSAHAIMMAGWISSVLFIEAFRRKSRLDGRDYVAGAIVFVAALLGIAQLFPTPADGQLQGLTEVRYRGALPSVLARSFLPQIPYGYAELQALFHGIRPLIAAAYVALRLFGAFLIAAICVFLWRRYRPMFWVFTLSTLSLLWIFTFKWICGDRHIGLVWLIALFALWVALRESPAGPTPRLARLALPAILFSLIYSTTAFLVTGWLEYTRAFSSAPEAAQLLQQQNLSGAIVVGHPAYAAESILPHMPANTRFWYPAMGDFGTHMPWNRQWEVGDAMSYDQAIRRSLEILPPHAELFFVFLHPLADPNAFGLTLVTETKGVLFGEARERYTIYRRESGGQLGPRATSP